MSKISTVFFCLIPLFVAGSGCGKTASKKDEAEKTVAAGAAAGKKAAEDEIKKARDALVADNEALIKTKEEIRKELQKEANDAVAKKAEADKALAELAKERAAIADLRKKVEDQEREIKKIREDLAGEPKKKVDVSPLSEPKGFVPAPGPADSRALFAEADFLAGEVAFIQKQIDLLVATKVPSNPVARDVAGQIIWHQWDKEYAKEKAAREKIHQERKLLLERKKDLVANYWAKIAQANQQREREMLAQFASLQKRAK